MPLLGYLPASFRGVPFHVDEEGEEGGRRLAVHDLAGAEAPVVEDMGRAAKKWSVRAYVSGPLWSPIAVALKGALDSPGPAILVLPWTGPVLVRVEDWSVSRVKDRHGIVELDIAFVEAGLGTVPFGLPPAINVVGALVVTAIGLLADALTASSSEVVDKSSGKRRAADAAEAMRRDVQVAATLSVKLSVEIEDLRASADALPAAEVIRRVGSVVRDIAREGAPGEVVASAGTLSLAFGAGGTLPPALVELLPEPEDGSDAIPTGSDADVVDAATAGVFMLANALASAVQTYGARVVAVAARDRLSDTWGEILPATAALGSQAQEAVTAAVLSAVDYISRDAAARAPMVRVETGVSMPATLLAWKLYGDPSRAAEVMEKAGSGTPMILPTVFEVEAPTVPLGG